MCKYVERAQELRNRTDVKINCAQAIAMSFAESAGVTEEAAMRFAAGFGGGMRRGAACGAVTGGLMVLGLFGISDPETLGQYHEQIRERHEGMLDCADLLRVIERTGEPKKQYCDAIIRECVTVVEKILQEKGCFDKNL